MGAKPHTTIANPFNNQQVKEAVRDLFEDNEVLSRKEIKERIRPVYEELNVTAAPCATHLLEYGFTFIKKHTIECDKVVEYLLLHKIPN